MALVAKMMAGQVNAGGGQRWEGCETDDPDAQDPAEVFKNHMYGVPKWLQDRPAVRQVRGQTSESITLSCVRGPSLDDPNAEFFTASPNGQLTMTIENPEAFGYIRPGKDYRVTIEEIRGPRARSITVNTRPFTVAGEAITYEQVVGLAGKKGRPTVTWSYRDGRGGSLLPGDDVDLADGCHFAAVHTTNASSCSSSSVRSSG